jgi:hypothetical protein|tara:strand:- start:216 stop:479 length:264 start_codon:yes stop_codon:yes gene_type:complete
MIIKFMMLSTFCFITPEMDMEKCGQTLHNYVPDAPQCRSFARSYGRDIKASLADKGASMTHYRAQCLAITNQGLDIDETFEISYNIL